MDKIIKKLGILWEEYLPYGHDKGKVHISLLERLKNKDNGKLILVTAITPTPAGEGKTTVSIGLAQGLKEIGKNPVIALREPSLGPVFGLKGGATGGGVSSVEPAVDINLHFTGDLHAISSAHNLLSALIDAHIFHGNELGIKEVVWPRTMDMNDRSLRNFETSLRKDRFVITAASEVMAILALATSYDNLKLRLGKILIGWDNEKNPVYVSQLGAEEAMTILLKDALKPNLVKTTDGVPAFIHAGPFANIAHGCNSVLATKMALKLGDYVVTDAGFGADLGMEKFLNLKMGQLDKNVDAIVIVATIRALKSHGESKDYNLPDLEALKRGAPHLERHINNIKKFNLPFVIALNHFVKDTDEEVDYLLNWAKEKGYEIALSKGFTLGGKGTTELARKVVEATNKESKFKKLYDVEDTLINKIKKVSKDIYGADDVIFSELALKKIEKFEELNWRLPICMAKTPLSLTDNPKIVDNPTGFNIHINNVTASLGAGFIVCLTKGIMVMPGLNKTPRALDMEIDSKGNVILWFY